MTRHPDHLPTTPAWRRYLRFWRRDVAADVDDELSFHIQMRIDDYVAEGMSPEDARRETMLRFGDLERVQTTCRDIGERWERDMRRTEWFDAIGQDVRFAVRQLRRSPVLALVAALTIALGVGANTAIFSVVHAVLLRPLPFDEPDRIVDVHETIRGSDGSSSVPGFDTWRREARSFEALAAYVGVGANLLGGSGEPERVFGGRVTTDYFRVLAMPPAAGRWFLPGEDVRGERVVVLSHALWQRRFAGDPKAVGADLTIDGRAHTIVGVAPAAFTLFREDDALWLPLAFTPDQLERWDEHYLSVFGRLRTDATAATATQELRRITEALAARHPIEMGERSAEAVPLRDTLVRGYRTQLLVLLGAVGFVLLIACGNVANLLLARATARAKEIAVRAALGAGRARIARQLLTESVVLALAGGIAGLVLARLGVRFLVAMGPEGVPRLGEAALSGPVLLFALAVTVASGIVFGLAPAARAMRQDVQTTLRQGGRSEANAGARDRLRGALVIAEVATALVLLVGAGLLIRSSMVLQQQELGFDPHGLISMRTALLADRYEDPARVRAVFLRIDEEVRSIPGVRAAAISSSTPLAGGSTNGLLAEGKAVDPANFVEATMRLVTSDYHRAMGIALVRGRLFRPEDRAGSPRVMLVNETAARQLYPGVDPIGKRVRCCDPGPEKEIVGVVADVRSRGLAAEPDAEFYMPVDQAPDVAWNWVQRAMTVVVRADDPAAATAAVRRAVGAVDPTIPVYNVRTFDEMLRRWTASSRFNTLLLTLLGATGLVLAAVGIYGVIAYLVGQRTQEIGVRVALGASSRQVLALVVRQGAVLALAGIVVGLVLAAAASKVLASLLYGVTPRDPLTYAAVAAVLLLVALVASWIPARRAARVDPMVAMRS